MTADEGLKWFNAVGTVVAAGAALYAAHVAKKQLQNLNETFRLGRLETLLQLESEINGRRTELTDVALELQKEIEKAKKEQNQREVDALNRRLRVKTESYLNAIDRLSYCILKDFFPEKDWRSEYREYIATDLRDHPEFFGPGTRYNNILKLHDKWRET